MEEGVPRGRVHLTGNTVVDATRLFAAEAKARSRILEVLGLAPRSYFVLTFHRAENVDERGRFLSFLESIERITAEHPDRQVVFPVHPRVEKRRLEFGAEWPQGVRPIAPLGYFDMLYLLTNSDLIITDSGGLQEEAAILGIPCVTLRESTERPETVAAGVNKVVGLQPQIVALAVASMRGHFAEPITAYGDGQAAHRIIRIIMSSFTKKTEASQETFAV
jgi:UDP-N-acetylglucosamine 2-epimerase (non-hydrolysing)